MFKLGIAGCGWAGQRHAAAAATHPSAVLTAVAEADGERRRRFAADWQVHHAFEDYHELCALDDLDAVIIALPHHLHMDAAGTAAGAGLHILCEKPIARTVAEADAMVDAARDGGVVLMVAESARFQPLNRRIEELLREGIIGRVVHVHRTWLHKFSRYDYADRPWLNSAEKAGGGQWLVNGVHVVSTLCSWLEAAGAGPVQQVLASEFRSPNFASPKGIEASVNALLTCGDGTAASIVMAVEVSHQNRFSGVRLYGTDGVMEVDEHRSRITIYRQEGEDRTTIDVPGNSEQSFSAQLDHFLWALAEPERSPVTDGITERNTLAIVEAGYHSLAEGRSMPVQHRSHR